MSEGLMCLKCRRYIGEQFNAWTCRCHEPMPSMDGRTEYHPNPLTPSFAALAKSNAITAAAPPARAFTMDELREAFNKIARAYKPLRFVRMTLAQLNVIEQEAGAAMRFESALNSAEAPKLYGLTILIAGRDEELADCLCRDCCHHLAPILPGTSFPIKAGHRWR